FCRANGGHRKSALPSTPITVWLTTLDPQQWRVAIRSTTCKGAKSRHERRLGIMPRRGYSAVIRRARSPAEGQRDELRARDTGSQLRSPASKRRSLQG